MDGFLTEPIVLSGRQSTEFMKSLRRPSREYLEKLSDVFTKMDREISIRREERDFEVEILGLDLSFIDEMEGRVMWPVHHLPFMNFVENK